MPQSDPQKNGWRAHALEGGILATEPFGEFVMVPFLQFKPSLGGGTSHLVGSAAAENADGSNQLISLSVNAGLPLGSAPFIRVSPFRGAYVGVRFDPAQASSGFIRDFDVIVDGVAYLVKKDAGLLVWDGTKYSPGTNGDHGVIVGPFADRHDHVLEIMIAGDATGNNFNNFYGLLLEKRAGYSEYQRGAFTTTPAAVPTSSTAIPLTSQGTLRQGRFVRSIIYTNTTGTAAVVTVTNTASNPTMAEITVAAHHYEVFDPKTFVTFDVGPTNTLKHSTPLAGMNFTVVVGGR